MSTKKIKARIENKHELEINWLKSNFIPLPGELILYDPEVDAEGNILMVEMQGEQKPAVPASILENGREDPISYTRFKIGDGVRNVNMLPFAEAALEAKINDLQLEVGNIYQHKVDTALTTSDKAVTGAINELHELIIKYSINIDYDRTLKFDVTELVISGGATSSILDVGMLDYMVLA